MKSIAQEERITKFYKYYLFCRDALWVGPIITLFYLLNELSYTEIFFIASYYKIAVSLFEVPTGAFADKFGHKRSVLLGITTIAISIALYPLISNFFYYILIETLLAIGATLVSGADESLFYDTLKKQNKEKEYTKLKGRASQYTYLSQLIGSLLAVFLYTINPTLPFIISGIIVFIGAIIFSTFKDIKHEKETTEEIGYIDQIKESGKYIFKHKKLRTIIIYAALINMLYMSLVHTYAPYFLSVGIKEEYFGVIFALFNIVALLASRNTDKYIKLTKPNSLIALGLLLMISFLILGLITLPIGIIGIMFQQIYRGVGKTTITKYINKIAPSAKRATILSYLSLTMTLLGGLFGIILGIIMDLTSINNTYLILTAITMIITITMYYFLKKNLSRN